MPPCPSLMDSDAANRRRWRSFRVEKVQRIASSTGRGYLVIITASCQKLKNPFPDRPDYQPNRAPKRPNATVNKFRILRKGPLVEIGPRSVFANSVVIRSIFSTCNALGQDGLPTLPDVPPSVCYPSGRHRQRRRPKPGGQRNL